MNFNRQIAVNHNSTVPTGNGRIVNNHVVVRKSSDTVESHLQCNLPPAIKKPAMRPTLFDRHLGRGQGFHLAIFRTKGEADLAS